MANFSLNDIRLSESILSDGDEVSVELALVNTDASGRAINRLQLFLSADAGDGYGLLTMGRADLQGVNIAYGADMRLNISINVDVDQPDLSGVSLRDFFEANPSARALPVHLTIQAHDSVYITSTSMNGMGVLLNKRYHPAVSRFAVERGVNGVPGDEGLQLLTTARLLASDNEAALLHAKLYFLENGSPGFMLPQRCTYPNAPMTADSSQNCRASASSVYGKETAAFHAMDGSKAQAWLSSANAAEPWIQLEMPTPLFDIEISLVNQLASPARGPISGVVYGVEKNGTLIPIGSFSGRDGQNSGVESVIACSNTEKAYDTVRLKISSWNGTGCAAVGEMRVSGYDLPLSQMPRCIDLTGSMPELLAGVEKSAQLVSGSFANGSSWCMMLWFGDDYESAWAYSTISRAFANMHLSGASSGGVCFGGFSAASEGWPLLESYYPARFHGGVEDFGGEWTALIPLAGSTPAAYGGGSLRCRAVENMRFVAGSLLVKPGGSTIALADLPEGFKPAASVFSMNACSGSRIARLAVHSDGDEFPGKLVLSWVWDLDEGKKYTTSEIWVQCSIAYWADDDAGSSEKATSILGQAVLGEMILGGD